MMIIYVINQRFFFPSTNFGEVILSDIACPSVSKVVEIQDKIGPLITLGQDNRILWALHTATNSSKLPPLHKPHSGIRYTTMIHGV